MKLLTNFASMKRPEQELQRACVKWFRLQYPKGLIHHSPNGMRSSVVQGSIFKSIGVLPGFPDLICIHNCNLFFVEMKSGKGKLSENQESVIERIQANGYDTYVVNSLDKFIEVCQLNFSTH